LQLTHWATSELTIDNVGTIATEEALGQFALFLQQDNPEL
jgi:hypothetical protein